MTYGFAEKERLLRGVKLQWLCVLFIVNYSNGCCAGFAPVLSNSPKMCFGHHIV